MLQATQVMCRTSRQVVNELNKYADAAHVQGFLIPAHVYMCDYMVIKYNQAAVMNVIKQHLGKVPPSRREFKHFTPIYWAKVVDNILSGKAGACREPGGPVYGEMVDYNSFNHLTKIFLDDDYTVSDAFRINTIVNTYTQADIVEACRIATKNAAHNIAYVEAVLRDMAATRRAEELRVKILGQKIEQSSAHVMQETHEHTPIELAKSEYDYNKKREDMLLELLVSKMLGGTGNDKK